MLILGLLLVVASGAAAAVLIAYNSGGTAQTVSAFGRDIADVTLMQAFLAGIVVALVFLLGISMVLMAGRRGRENRARYREARREAKAAAAERDRLAEQLRKDEEARSGHHDQHHDQRHDQTMVTQPVARPADQPTDSSMGSSAGHAQQPTQPVANPGHAAPTSPSGRHDPVHPNDPNHPTQQQPVITNIRPGQSPSR